MADDGAERILVALREGETVVVLPLLVLENKIAAVGDLLVGDVRQLVRVLSGILRHRSDKKAERGNALLTVNDKELVHTGGANPPPSTMTTDPVKCAPEPRRPTETISSQSCRHCSSSHKQAYR